METFFRDLRYSFRTSLRNPVLTGAVILSVALAIGANTAIFTLLNAVLSPMPPVAKPRELVSIYMADKDQPDLIGVAHSNFVDFRDGNKTFRNLTAYWSLALALSDAKGSEMVWGELVAPNYFEVLGIEVAAGRAFRAEEGEAHGEATLVAVLSDALWRRKFGADPKIVGRTITLNAKEFEVVGIAPAGFVGLKLLEAPVDLWVPTSSAQRILSEGLWDVFLNRREAVFGTVGRLAAGADRAAAEADLNAILAKIYEDYDRFVKGRSVRVRPFADAVVHPSVRGDVSLAGGLLLAIAALVLTIACANVANLLLARATRRRKEMAVRLSLGVSRARLLRQLLTESVSLALIGGLAGLGIAVWLRRALWDWSQPFLPFTVALPLDMRVLAFTFTLSVLTGILFGLIPALQATRTDITTSLHESGIAPPSRLQRRFRIGPVLVVGQIALSLVALIVAILFGRSLLHLQNVDPGFETQKLALISFSELGGIGYDKAAGRAFYQKAIDSARSLPGVESVSLSAFMPLVDGGAVTTIYLDGQEQEENGEQTQVLYNSVYPDFFETLGIPLVRGRNFVLEDMDNLPRAAIVNETMAATYWPGQDAIGQKFMIFGLSRQFVVTGIARDSKYKFLGEEPRPHLYFGPYHYRSVANLYVRTSGDPAALLEPLRATIEKIDPNVPLVNVASVQEVIDQALWAPRLAAYLLAIFGALALLLAMIGAYGVMSYVIGQRRSEIGVRMAIGAHASSVLALFLKRGMRTVAIGAALGLVLAAATTHAVAKFLRGVGPTDPLTFMLATAFLVLVTFVAVYVSTRRATQIDPTVVLRAE